MDYQSYHRLRLLVIDTERHHVGRILAILRLAKQLLVRKAMP